MEKAKALLFVVGLLIFGTSCQSRVGNDALSLLLSGQPYPNEEQLEANFSAKKESFVQLADLNAQVFTLRTEDGANTIEERAYELTNSLNISKTYNGSNQCDVTFITYHVRWQGVYTERGYAHLCNSAENYRQIQTAEPEFFLFDIESIDEIKADYYEAFQLIEDEWYLYARSFPVPNAQ